jgi:hypothetical protein
MGIEERALARAQREQAYSRTEVPFSEKLWMTWRCSLICSYANKSTFTRWRSMRSNPCDAPAPPLCKWAGLFSSDRFAMCYPGLRWLLYAPPI